jgi:hypothetical protein
MALRYRPTDAGPIDRRGYARERPAPFGRRDRKLAPDLTVQGFVSLIPLFSENPVFTQQVVGIAEGLRKAGLPEGDKKTD